jgi:hypothetical protein
MSQTCIDTSSQDGTATWSSVKSVGTRFHGVWMPWDEPGNQRELHIRELGKGLEQYLLRGGGVNIQVLTTEIQTRHERGSERSPCR